MFKMEKNIIVFTLIIASLNLKHLNGCLKKTSDFKKFLLESAANTPLQIFNSYNLIIRSQNFSQANN